MTARNVVVDGEVFTLVPAELGAEIGETYLRSVEVTEARHPDYPRDQARCDVARMMTTAAILKPGGMTTIATISDVGSRVTDGTHDAVAVTEAAALLGVTPRRIRQLCAAGALPGARRTGGAWIIPVAAIDRYRQDHP